jgi:hypothetical protein
MADTIDLRPSQRSSRRSIARPRVVTFRKRRCGPSCQPVKRETETSPSWTSMLFLRRSNWTRAERLTHLEFCTSMRRCSEEYRSARSRVCGGSCISSHFCGRYDRSPAFVGGTGNGRRRGEGNTDAAKAAALEEGQDEEEDAERIALRSWFCRLARYRYFEPLIYRIHSVTGV